MSELSQSGWIKMMRYVDNGRPVEKYLISPYDLTLKAIRNVIIAAVEVG